MSPFNFGKNFLEEQSQAIQNLEERIVNKSISLEELISILESLVKNVQNKENINELVEKIHSLHIDEKVEKNIENIIIQLKQSQIVENIDQPITNPEVTEPSFIQVYDEWTDSDNSYDTGDWYDGLSFSSDMKEDSDKDNSLIRLEGELSDVVDNEVVIESESPSFEGVNIVVADEGIADQLKINRYDVDSNIPQDVFPYEYIEGLQQSLLERSKTRNMDNDENIYEETVSPDNIVAEDTPQEVDSDVSILEEEVLESTEELSLNESEDVTGLVEDNLENTIQDDFVETTEQNIKEEPLIADEPIYSDILQPDSELLDIRDEGIVGDEDIQSDFDAVVSFDTPEILDHHSIENVKEDIILEEENIEADIFESKNCKISISFSDEVASKVLEKIQSADSIFNLSQMEMKNIMLEVLGSSSYNALDINQKETVKTEVSHNPIAESIKMEESLEPVIQEEKEEMVGTSVPVIEKNKIEEKTLKYKEISDNEDTLGSKKWWESLPVLEYSEREDLGPFIIIRDLG